MTWSLSAAGHHSTDDWKAEEHELLRRLVDAVEADGGATVASTFSFSGNHVQASSLVDARTKLAAYDEAREPGEDDAATSPETPEESQ